MKVKSIKTRIIAKGKTIESLLDDYLVSINDGSILAITSKVVSICEGNIRSDIRDKDELIREEADQYLESDSPFVLTIKNNVLIPSAGIDESNGDGNLILWPKDPFASARKIYDYLSKKFSLKNFGVIITDSKTSPLRWGTTGVAIAYAGFVALRDYRGEEDIFGRKLAVTQANYVDALASSAVLVMGEGAEMTPMALIEDLPFINFDSNSPTKKEIEDSKIKVDDDIYGPLLSSVPWKKGK